MNKKLILFSSVVLVVAFISCGPAAEERAKMMQSAKRTADSIANVITVSMSSATNSPVAPVVPPATVASSAISTPSVAPPKK